MVYINDRGEVMKSRPLFSIAFVKYAVGGALDFIVMFFRSLFMMESSSSGGIGSSGRGGNRGGGPGGGGGGGPGRPGNGGGPRIAGFGPSERGPNMGCSACSTCG